MIIIFPSIYTYKSISGNNKFEKKGKNCWWGKKKAREDENTGITQFNNQNSYT